MSKSIDDLRNRINKSWSPFRISFFSDIQSKARGGGATDLNFTGLRQRKNFLNPAPEFCPPNDRQF